MKPSARFAHSRFAKILSLFLCGCFIASTLFVPWQVTYAKYDQSSGSTAWSGNPGKLLAALLAFFQGGGGPPSIPGTNLPDLDVARGLQPADPNAPAAIASDQACTDCAPCPTCGPGVANHAPVVKSGGPYYGTVGTPLIVNGLGSFDVDPGDGISVYSWTFGDGSGVFNGAMPSHTYQATGNFQVSLTVTDNHNATSSASTTASIAAAPPSVPPSGTTQGNAALFITQSVPTSMTAGQTYPVSVTMRNTGTMTWTAAHLYRLGSQNPQDNTTWGRPRIYLPTAVAPGGDVTFNFTVIAPFNGVEEPPSAYFQWRMVEDGVEWFGDYTTNQTVNIVSNYAPAHPGGLQFGPFSDLFASRIAVEHRTGEPGEDLLSGNFNWGLGLVGLAGRSGLNLNLGLSYNSLAAWTKVVPPESDLPPEYQQPTSFTFDADRGFPSVGFRLGFPSIQGPFYNNQTGRNSYLMLMPSGSRAELRQVGATNVYEAADSSYLQLLDGGNGSLLLRTTDGTQLAYWSINSEYRCTEVKDTNGNYITIKYDPINGIANLGRMTSVIDTLGRSINFNYDANYRLQTITQLRNGQTHVRASFGYTDRTIQTNFVNSVPVEGEEPVIDVSGPPVVLGLPANRVVSLLSQVGLDDGSRYTFDYTTWGQVLQIKHFAPDGHQLNFISYNLPFDNNAAQSDCPRFSQKEDSAENWNNNNGVGTTFQIGWNGTSGQMTTAAGTPDQVTYKEFFTTDYSDWRRGLVTRTEIFTPNSTTPKKTTITDWTQDNISVSYPLNPRPAATTISDAEGNRRRTTIDYTSFGLPADLYEMGPVGTSDWRILRRTHTDYNLSDVYVNRRIIGLVAGQYVFAPDAPNSNSIQTLMAKTTLEYDNAVCSGFCYILGPEEQEPEAPIDPVVHHDPTYNVGFQIGRGLLASIKRWDAFDEMNVTKVTTSSLLYNIYGSMIRSTDPLQHRTQIHYDDSFSSDGVSSTSAPFVTMAYPTSVSDPDSFFSSAKYSYDLGLATRQQDPKGAAHTTEYDVAGRVKRVTNAVNSAYTRFVYLPSQTIVNKFTTINDLATETYSATVFDGAGRVRAVAGDFPNSTGHYSGQFTLYDQQGRAVQSTNPTEMTHAWAAAGDDLIGWYSTLQTYDWKGRPLVTTNQDGTTKKASYGGCGCAGGEVITLTDEGTIVDIDPGPGINNVSKIRQQKIYSDSLGRKLKTEVLNWDGPGAFGAGGSIYSTILNTYDALDHITLERQYEGPSTSTVFQDTIMTYDGYGRLKTKHAPQQQVDSNNSSSSDHTTWNYYADDTVQSVIDARGTTETFTYDKRQLVKTISYSAPAGINAAAPVSYGYDAVGNRTSMSDGMGSMSYDYDPLLSRLRSETRTFTSLGTFQISYDYNLAGQLTSVTDPFGAQVSYNHDNAGRVESVTGSGFAGVSNYALNIHYRAWGSQKSVTYGDDKSGTTSYDARMRPVAYDFPELREQFQYYVDGRLRQMTDLDDRPQNGNGDTSRHFSRIQSYDQMGRLTSVNPIESSGLPFRQNYGYEAFGNLATRMGSYYYQTQTIDNATFQNDRRQGWDYYADGQVQHNPIAFDSNGNVIASRDWTYDAAGRMVQVQETITNPNSVSTYTTSYDGDGQSVRESSTATAYLIRSSVLGGKVLTRLDNAGNKSSTNVDVDGLLMVVQNVSSFGSSVVWTHIDPLGMSEAGDTKPVYDPMGNYIPWQHVPTAPPNAYPPIAASYGGLGPSFGYSINSSCILDDIPTDCNLAFNMLSHGSAEQCPNNYCGAGRARNGDLVPLRRDPDTGLLGYYSTPQNPVVGREDLKAYKARIEQMLKDPECARFINKLLNEAKTLTGRFYNDVLVTFDSIKFYWVKESTGKGGHAFFEKGSPVATIGNTIKTEKFISADRTGFLIGMSTQSFFGETLHHVGVGGMYGDGVMAQALNNILVSQGKAQPQTFDLRGVDPKGVDDASTYWHPKVWDHCKAPRQ